MVCEYCGRQTKNGFPYCMNCGEWIGSASASECATPGSWGNPVFEKRPARLFLARRLDTSASRLSGSTTR